MVNGNEPSKLKPMKEEKVGNPKKPNRGGKERGDAAPKSESLMPRDTEKRFDF